MDVDVKPEEIAAIVVSMNREHKQTGHVYVAACGDAVKIGYSRSPVDRVTSLHQQGFKGIRMLGHFPGSLKLEKRLQRHLISRRIRFEWFDLNPDEAKAIVEAGSNPLNYVSPDVVCDNEPKAVLLSVLVPDWFVEEIEAERKVRGLRSAAVILRERLGCPQPGSTEWAEMVKAEPLDVPYRRQRRKRKAA